MAPVITANSVGKDGYTVIFSDSTLYSPPHRKGRGAVRKVTEL